MTNPAVSAKDMLVTAGVGTFGASSGWGIYIGQEPTDPKTVVTLFSTGGRASNPL